MTQRHCQTCDASHTNTIERIIRCGTCVAMPPGMPTKWKRKEGCDHCLHPLYAGIRCGVCGRWTEKTNDHD